MKNYFAYADEEYGRDLDPIRHYIELTAFYLSRISGKPEEEMREFVIKNIKPGGQFPIRNPTVRYFCKLETKDRVKKTCKWTDYIKLINQNNLILSPSWTGWMPYSRKPSLYRGYIEYRSGVRSAYKKQLFLAELKNDANGINFFDGMQQSSKIYINSISGASMDVHTINYMPTLHPALTSTCALSTSLANLNNEKLIRGNRPYLNFDMTLDNIVVITRCSDYPALQKAMDEYNLVYPTVDDVMECVTYSSHLYWRNEEKLAKIRQFVETMKPIERAAFVYVGDLYHIYKHNKEVFVDFFNGFTNRTSESFDIERADAEIKDTDNDTDILARLICSEYLAGKTLQELKEENPEQYGEVAANMKMVKDHMDKYEIFIKGLLRPPIMNPGSNIKVMKSLIRRAVLTSDTDSTIFTSQYWVKELCGYIGFEKRHYNVGYTISFLVNKTVFHQLALMSGNLGFEQRDLHIISMKNEYYFPVYALTNSSKNYFAYKSVREGNIFPKMKLEKKGVELLSAKIPSAVMDRFDDWLKHLMDTIIAKNKITIDDIFGIPYETEMMVKQSILEGKVIYFQRGQAKDASAYIKGNDAPALQNHRTWENIFGEKYGHAPDFPYTFLKVSVDLTKKSKMKEWLLNIKDKEIASLANSHFVNTGTHTLSMFAVPALTIGKNTLPQEIIDCIDVNKQIMNVTSPFYVVLETLGFYLRNSDYCTMIYEYYGNYKKSKGL